MYKADATEKCVSDLKLSVCALFNISHVRNVFLIILMLHRIVLSSYRTGHCDCIYCIFKMITIWHFTLCAGQIKEFILVETIFSSERLRREWNCCKEIWASFKQKFLQTTLPKFSCQLVEIIQVWDLSFAEIYYFVATICHRLLLAHLNIMLIDTTSSSCRSSFLLKSNWWSVIVDLCLLCTTQKKLWYDSGGIILFFQFSFSFHNKCIATPMYFF